MKKHMMPTTLHGYTNNQCTLLFDGMLDRFNWGVNQAILRRSKYTDIDNKITDFSRYKTLDLTGFFKRLF